MNEWLNDFTTILFILKPIYIKIHDNLLTNKLIKISHYFTYNTIKPSFIHILHFTPSYVNPIKKLIPMNGWMLKQNKIT